MGIWGEASSGDPGQSPGQGTGRQSLPEAETLLAFGRLLKAANLPTL